MIVKEHHMILPLTLTFTELSPGFLSTPIVGAQGEQFDDGSCYKDHSGNHAGFAVGRQKPEKNCLLSFIFSW